MHVFQIKGFSSVILLLLAIVAALLVFLLLPASFLMVFWNAVVFEGFKGPDIDIYQGLALWGMLLIALKLVLKPEIRVEFVKMAPPQQQKNKTASKSVTTRVETPDAQADLSESSSQQSE